MALAHLVLIGGGHTHAIVLHCLSRQPWPRVQITLISNVLETAYSGMLPGHVAGLYTHADCHIDLQALCESAQVDFVLATAIALDVQQNRVRCQQLDKTFELDFDYVSIDIGSTPKIPKIASPHLPSIAAKPIPQFLAWWQDEVETPRSKTIAIIGGGAGGVELALNIQARSNDRILHLIHSSRDILPSYNSWVRQYFTQQLNQRNIQVHGNETVVTIDEKNVICQSNLTIACDVALWITQATAPDWITASGLGTDDRGFIWVNSCLQSITHPHIFAAGDIATMQDAPRPKAGVFAVRQGRPLFDNLRRAIAHQTLKPYQPQTRILSLIGTGDRTAVAAWGHFGWASPLLWILKDRIDRAFMHQFTAPSK